MEMLAIVREYKYSDPLRALRAMDDSDVATRLWRAAVERDATRVGEEIARLCETDHSWRSLRNPAAVVLRNLQTIGLCG